MATFKLGSGSSAFVDVFEERKNSDALLGFMQNNR